MQFSAGLLPNALGVMLACHLQQCSRCREKARRYEQLGGEILANAAPVDVSPAALDSLLARLDQPAVAEETTAPVQGPEDIPRPLRRFVPAGFDELAWSGMTKSIKEYEIKIEDPNYTAKFYRIAAGKELPEHTHRGNEFTLVMEGSFSDKAGDYHAGDFILADTTTVHQPRASECGDCICFAVMDAPLKMTGFFGRMLNPFMR